MKFLPPLLALLLCACSDSETGSSVSVAASSDADLPSAAAIEEAGIDEVMQMNEAVLKEVEALIAGVTDAETAKAARPALEQIAKRIEPLKARLQELKGSSAANKLAFGQSMLGSMSTIDSLGQEFARLEGVPGVREELDEVMTKILSIFGT